MRNMIPRGDSPPIPSIYDYGNVMDRNVRGAANHTNGRKKKKKKFKMRQGRQNDQVKKVFTFDMVLIEN